MKDKIYKEYKKKKLICLLFRMNWELKIAYATHDVASALLCCCSVDVAIALAASDALPVCLPHCLPDSFLPYPSKHESCHINFLGCCLIWSENLLYTFRINLRFFVLFCVWGSTAFVAFSQKCCVGSWVFWEFLID